VNKGDRVARISNGAQGEIISEVHPGDERIHVRFGGSTANVAKADLVLAAAKAWPPAEIETK
jgi:hypothetical protein